MGERWQDNGVPATYRAGTEELRVRPEDRLFTTWITTEDGIDHAVTDEMMAAGIQSLDGRFSAVCSEVVSAAFLVVPPGRECARCRAALGSRSCARSGGRWSAVTQPMRRPVFSWFRDLLSAGAGRRAPLID